MTAPAGKQFGIGFRHINFFELNSNLLPQGASDSASDTAGYEGLQYVSARGLTIAYPKPRTIVQPGDDRVEALQTFMQMLREYSMRSLSNLCVLTST